MRHLDLIEFLYDKLKREKLWFVTKEDCKSNIWLGKPKKYFKLDKYGELEDPEKTYTDITNLVGDGAETLNEAVRMFIDLCVADNSIASKEFLRTKYEPKPIVPGTTAVEANVDIPCKTGKVIESKEVITEAIDNTVTYKEFKDRVTELYHSVLPDCAIRFSLGALSGHDFFITMYLAKDKSEVANGIAQNDVFHITFFIQKCSDERLTDDTVLSNEIILEPTQKSITTKPEIQYMAYGSESLPFRKTKGTPEKIISTLDKYIHIIRDTLQKLVDEDKIHDNHIELVKKKLGESKDLQIKTEEISDDLKDTLGGVIGKKKGQKIKDNNNWFNVKGAKYNYHGDWSDPTVELDGYEYNYYDIAEYVEEILSEDYAEENKELPTGKEYDDIFDSYMNEYASSAFADLIPVKIAGWLNDDIRFTYDFGDLHKLVDTLKTMTSTPTKVINKIEQLIKTEESELDPDITTENEEEVVKELQPKIKDILNDMTEYGNAMYESKNLNESKSSKLHPMPKKLFNKIKEIKEMYDENILNSDGDVFANTADSYANEMLENDLVDLYHDNDFKIYVFEHNDATTPELFKQVFNNIIQELYNKIVAGDISDLYSTPRQKIKKVETKSEQIELAKVESKIRKYLESKKVYADVYMPNFNKVEVTIEYSDWKHDHRFCDYLMQNIGFKLTKEDIFDADGSDWYSATRYYEGTYQEPEDINNLKNENKKKIETKPEKPDLIKSYTVTDYGFRNNIDSIYGELNDGNWYVYNTFSGDFMVYNSPITNKYIDSFYNYSTDYPTADDEWYDNFTKEHEITDNYNENLINKIINKLDYIYDNRDFVYDKKININNNSKKEEDYFDKIDQIRKKAEDDMIAALKEKFPEAKVSDVIESKYSGDRILLTINGKKVTIYFMDEQGEDGKPWFMVIKNKKNKDSYTGNIEDVIKYIKTNILVETKKVENWKYKSLNDMAEANNKEIVAYNKVLDTDTGIENIFDFSSKNGGAIDSFKYYNNYVVVDKRNNNKKVENVQRRLNEENNKSANIISDMFTADDFDSNSKQGQIVMRTSQLFNALSDKGYDVQVAFDNGESTNAILLGQEGGQVVITITDNTTPLKAYINGNIELDQDILKTLDDINKEIKSL